MEECEGGKDWLGIKFLPVSHEITLHRAIARSRRGRRLYNVGQEFWKVTSKWVSGAVNLGEGDANNIVVSSARGRKGVRANGISLEKGKPTDSPSKGPQRARTNYRPLSKDEHQPFPRHPAVMPGLFNFVGC